MITSKYIEEWDITIVMVYHWALEKRKLDYHHGRDFHSDVNSHLTELFSHLELQVLEAFETLREPTREELKVLIDLAAVKSAEWQQIFQLAFNKRLILPTAWLESFLLEIFSE